MPKPNNTIETLLQRTTKQPNGCWLWTGRVNHKGYPIASWNGKESRVHRVVFENFHGAIQEGHQICHRCDTPRCINPKHLFAGTAWDNEHDKIAKGRHRNRWTGKLVAGSRVELETEGYEPSEIPFLYPASDNLVR